MPNDFEIFGCMDSVIIPLSVELLVVKVVPVVGWWFTSSIAAMWMGQACCLPM